MIQETLLEKIRSAAELIGQSTNIVAFTGAGISTDSGIPDYRSPKSGVWNDTDQFTVASIYGFKQNPKAFYKWVRPLTEMILNAQPNPAHEALVDLERMGLLKAVITQNIDVLHTRAGNSTIHELHGHIRTATCIYCFKKYDGLQIIKQCLKNGTVPHCTECREGIIKPDVILFGEQLPINEFQAAQQAARKADLMIVIGSSLEVAPAGDIPLLAKHNGAKLIIVNLEPTPVDRYAEVVINARAAEILPELVRQVEKIP